MQEKPECCNGEGAAHQQSWQIRDANAFDFQPLQAYLNAKRLEDGTFFLHFILPVRCPYHRLRSVRQTTKTHLGALRIRDKAPPVPIKRTSSPINHSDAQ